MEKETHFTPWERFSSDPRPLRLPQSKAELRSMFVVLEERRIEADHVISVDSVAYEVPRGMTIQRTALVYRQVLDGTLSVLFQGELVEIHPVDCAANARSRRGKPQECEIAELPPKSAAERHYEQDLGPIIDHEGNCPHAEGDNP